MFLVMLDGAATGASWNEAEARALADRIEGATVEARPDGIDYNEAAAILARQCERLGLKVEWAFVPFSHSRSAREDNPSLNWRATLNIGVGGLTVDYMQGIGHAPCAKMEGADPYWRNAAKRAEYQKAAHIEAESGFVASIAFGSIRQSGRRIPPPSLADLVSCLARDWDVLESGGFESWASDLGYSTDSRKAESIYRQCLEQSLALQAAIGPRELESLRTLAREM